MFPTATIAQIARGRGGIGAWYVSRWALAVICAIASAAGVIAMYFGSRDFAPGARVAGIVVFGLMALLLPLLVFRPVTYERRPVGDLQVDDLIVISRFSVGSSGVTGSILGKIGLTTEARPLLSKAAAPDESARVELVLAAEPRPELYLATDTVRVAMPLLAKAPNERADRAEVEDLMALIATGDPSWISRAPDAEVQQACRLRLAESWPGREPRLTESGIAATYHARGR